MSLKLLKKKNYLAIIENSVKGENWMFRNLYAEINGREEDILNGGKWSCAIFVSSILYLFKLLGDLHTNVKSTETDMIKNGWQEIRDLRQGAVLIWEKKIAIDDNKDHYHIGFYWSDNIAISNDSQKTGFPHKHHYTYNDTRKIEKIYWHSALDE